MQKRLKNKLLSNRGFGQVDNANDDEAEIAKLVLDGGLKPETLARRKRVRVAFQAFIVYF